MVSDCKNKKDQRTQWLFCFWFFNLVVICIVLISACNQDKAVHGNRVKLRSQYITILVAEASKMVTQKDFFDKYWNNSGDFENQFESTTIKNDKIVTDHATGLIWHQSGSSDFMTVNEAFKWISELNCTQYAGINNWRLPTLEEALSLLENQKMNGNLYIDPAFDAWQWCILTGDTLTLNKNWLVAFSGRIDWFDSNVSINYVRPVSSMAAE
jgi:hypothetical protein